MLELLGLNEDKIDALDGNSEPCRRIYFWRNSLRTLVEIRNTLNTLNGLSPFREWLNRRPDEVRSSYENVKKQINKACEEFLYGLRCEIGAHLDETAMHEALQTMSFDRGGMIEIGELTKDIHYKFVGELLVSVLLRAAAEEDLTLKLNEILRRTASLIPAINAMDTIISLYLKDRIPQ